MDIRSEIEKMASDVTSGPSLSDTVEVGLLGAALGAGIGYFKDRSRETAKSFAAWGAGLSVAGQYMLFHMLRPSAASRYGYMVGAGQDCGPTAYWDDSQQACVEVSLPGAHGGPAMTCPPGFFLDYFTGHCVSQAPAPARVGIQSGPAIVGAGASAGAGAGFGGCGGGAYFDEASGNCTCANPGEQYDSGSQSCVRNMMPVLGCPPGQEWSDWFAACVPSGIPAPPRVGIQSGPAIVGIQSGPALVGGPEDFLPPPLQDLLPQNVPLTPLHQDVQCPPNQHLELHHGQFVCSPDLPSFLQPPDNVAPLFRTGAVDRGGYGGGMPYGPGPWPVR